MAVYPAMSDEVKFLADEMLGRLAKWLRILGYDTAYLSPASDHALVRLARAEGRVLLTRDTGLARRRGLQILLIESEQVEEQVRQVLDDLSLTASGSFSRCPVCNTPLEELDRAAVADRVPPYVLRTQERFSRCPHCDRTYWRGTHWARMRERIEELRRGANKAG
ncbi:MAG: Mut7-C RNAse domain-containing protein [Anaerolineae bacterium]